MPVKEISHEDMQSTDSCSPLRFHMPYGNQFWWILSWHFQSRKEKPKSWSWLTTLRKWLTSSLARNSHGNWNSTSFHKGNLEDTWPANRYCLRQRHKMDRRVLERNFWPTRHKKETVNSILPADRRTNWKGKPNPRNIYTNVHQLRPRRLGPKCCH